MFKYIVKNGKNVTLVQFFSLGGGGGWILMKDTIKLKLALDDMRK